MQQGGGGMIDSMFDRLRSEGRAALMPYVTAGYPTLDATAQVISAIDAAGADVIEIGFPFSDPIADGPVIAASMHEALAAGATPTGVFEVVRRVREATSAAMVAMVSDSIVHRMGSEVFIEHAASAGFDGLILPDIDLEEASCVGQLAAASGLSFSLLVAPTSSEQRIERIVSLCSGFVYVLARVGITGERSDLPDLEILVQRVRAYTDLPLAVGFGISTGQQVSRVAELADGVIVGSALVRRMGESDDPVAAAHEFVSTLAKPLRAAASRQ